MPELRPPPAGRKLILELRRELKAAGDPERAKGQQAYMKSEMPFWGVTGVKTRAGSAWNGAEPWICL